MPSVITMKPGVNLLKIDYARQCFHLEQEIERLKEDVKRWKNNFRNLEKKLLKESVAYNKLKEESNE